MTPEVEREALEHCLYIRAKLDKIEFDMAEIRDCLVRIETSVDAAQRHLNTPRKQS